MSNSEPVVSIMPQQYPDGSFGVTMVITGLSEKDALSAADFLANTFCEKEIKPS